MEESQEVWKDYIIVRDGKYWRVFREHHYYGGLFTMLSKARAYVDVLVNNKEIEDYKRL